MKNTKFLFSILLSFIFSISLAQIDSNERAKLYFQEAQSSFNQNNYEQCLEYLDDVEKILGSTNGRILNLRIKSHYNNGQFLKAEKSLNLFIDNYSNSVTPELKSETLSYLVRIERAAKEQIANIQQAQEEEEREKREKRLKKIREINMYGFCNNLTATSSWRFGKKKDRSGIPKDALVLKYEVTWSSYSDLITFKRTGHYAYIFTGGGYKYLEPYNFKVARTKLRDLEWEVDDSPLSNQYGRSFNVYVIYEGSGLKKQFIGKIHESNLDDIVKAKKLIPLFK